MRATHGRAPIRSCIASALMKWPSASSHERIAAARMPSSRDAAPLQVAARPTTTLRPAYGSSSAYSASARAPSPSAPHTSASSVTPISQFASRGRSSKPPAASVSNSARASSIRPSSTSSSASAARHATSAG